MLSATNFSCALDTAVKPRRACEADRFAAAGDDFKVMCRRVDDFVGATIVLACVERYVDGVADDVVQKAARPARGEIPVF